MEKINNKYYCSISNLFSNYSDLDYKGDFKNKYNIDVEFMFIMWLHKKDYNKICP